MMLTVALCLALAQGQTISFVQPMAPLEQVVPALATATGLDLKVAPEVRWRMVYVRAKEVSPAELMKQVARATGTRWEVVSGVQYLRVDPVVAQKKRDQESQEQRKQLTGYLKAKQADGLAKVAQQMIAAIGVNALMTMPDESRVVFATPNTAMQRQFPSFNQSWVAQITAAHNSRVDMQANRGQEEEEMMKQVEEAVGPELMARIRQIEEAQRGKKIDGQLAKIMLIIERQKNFSGQLRAYDSKGNMAVQEYVWFGGYEAETMEPPAPDQPQEPEKPEPEDKSPKLKHSPELSQLMKDITAITAGGAKDKAAIKSRLQELMGKPDEKELISSVQSDLLDAYAKHTSDNLVVASQPFFFDWADGNVTVNAMKAMLEDDTEDPKGWIVYSESDDDAPDLAVLREAIDRMKGKDEITLNDKAWYAANLGDQFPYSSLGGVYQVVFDLPQIAGNIGLKFFGTLTDGQRKAAWSGQPLNFASLGAKSKALLQKMAFGPSPSFSPRSMSRDDMFGMFGGDMEAMITAAIEEATSERTYLNEPTEAMPNGLPSNGVVEFNPSAGKAYSMGSDNMGMFGASMPAFKVDQLAQMMAMFSMMPAEMQGGMAGSLPKEVTEVDEKILAMRIRPTAQVQYVENLREVSGLKTGAKKKLADWPEYQAAFDAAKKKSAKYSKLLGLGFGMGSGQVKPPL